mmetsp:Transcript_16867/g.54009  ORF Transcript_16867/g.54009 Transcript_16867/m.54009 type:complete len:252 (+) Transcript_16867:1897-2652(+)
MLVAVDSKSSLPGLRGGGVCTLVGCAWSARYKPTKRSSTTTASSSDAFTAFVRPFSSTCFTRSESNTARSSPTAASRTRSSTGTGLMRDTWFTASRTTPDRRHSCGCSVRRPSRRRRRSSTSSTRTLQAPTARSRAVSSWESSWSGLNGHASRMIQSAPAMTWMGLRSSCMTYPRVALCASMDASCTARCRSSRRVRRLMASALSLAKPSLSTWKRTKKQMVMNMMWPPRNRKLCLSTDTSRAKQTTSQAT